MGQKKLLSFGVTKLVAFIYMTLSVILVPWTVYLAVTLPGHHLSRHWDVAWVGLDAAITFMLLLTGYLTYKGSKLVAIIASSAGTLLVVDAWFDIMSERPGAQLDEAIALAFFVELPLAFITYFVAYHMAGYNTKP